MKEIGKIHEGVCVCVCVCVYSCVSMGNCVRVCVYECESLWGEDLIFI